jgi:hypothetical protein
MLMLNLHLIGHDNMIQIALIHALFLIAEIKQSQKFAKLEKEYKFTSIYLTRQHLMILH